MAFNIEYAMQAYMAWNKIKDVSLGDVDEPTIDSIANIFGAKLAPEYRSAILSMIIAQDPETLVGNFITSGGLFNMVANRAAGGDGTVQVSVTRCPHCNELHT